MQPQKFLIAVSSGLLLWRCRCRGVEQRELLRLAHAADEAAVGQKRSSSHAVGIVVSRSRCSKRHESASPTSPFAAFCRLRASRKCLFLFASLFRSVSTRSRSCGSEPRTNSTARGTPSLGERYTGLLSLGVVEEVGVKVDQVEPETERAFTQAFFSSAETPAIRRSASRDPHRDSRSASAAHRHRRATPQANACLDRELETTGCAHIENQNNEFKQSQ